MKDSLKIGLGIVIGVLGVALCALCTSVAIGAGGLAFLDTFLPSSEQPILLVQASATLQPIPQPIGSEMRHEDFAVTLLEYEFSGSYRGEYDVDEEPPEGAKFLWVHILVRNVGQNAGDSPSPSDFSLIHLGEQIGRGFSLGKGPGYEQYDGGEIFPGVSREGWLRFTLPKAAEPRQIVVVWEPFLAEEFGSWQLSP